MGSTFDDAESTLVQNASHTMAGQPAPLPPPPGSDEELESTCVQHAPADSARTIAGRYVVEGELGEGGMGKVLRVKHQQLGKTFALKLIHQRVLSNDRARASFFREARLASSLEHPNIVSVVDFGEDPKAGAFMVMELLDGEPLATRLQAHGKLALKPACDTILQIAEALHYIHSRGVVHCDIKSENVLLCRVPTSTERRRWQVKLLDFGIARVSADDGRRTQSLEGTPGYLAPERIEGLAPQPSMDIYSLGVLAYEILTGTLPFQGGIHELLLAHTSREPEPLSRRLGEPIDDRAEALVMRALAKRPEDRQRDMAAFVYELRTLMDMVGMNRRARSRRAEAPGTPPPQKDRAHQGVQVGYQVTPVPMAGIDADGTILVANRAFAQFLTGDQDRALEGTPIASTLLARVHRTLTKDLAAVHADGLARHRVIVLRDGNRRLRLMLWLMPGTQDAGDVHLTIHPLDT